MKARSSDEFPLELEEAEAYYAAVSGSLVEEFRRAVNFAVVEVIEHPQKWPFLDGNFRRYRLDDFPYAIVYEIQSDEIFISALMHLHRKPGYWKGRT